MFYGIGVVCDDYFVPALEEMSERYSITEDVAGATFMAAGGSAPEFFTSLMGVTVSNNDVGFGTIVGSAVFNVLFVIGVCGVFANETLQLTWWPLFRDCNYYIISLLILSYFIRDQKISFTEALGLFFLYIGYVAIMKYNEKCKNFVSKMVPWSDKVDPQDETAVEETAKVFKTQRSDSKDKLGASGGSDSEQSDRSGNASAVPRRRRRSLTPLMVEVRKAKKDGGNLPAHVVRDLEMLSTSFKFHSSHKKSPGDGDVESKGALSKFKIGARKVIENKRLATHAELVLGKDDIRARIANLPGAVGEEEEAENGQNIMRQSTGAQDGEGGDKNDKNGSSGDEDRSNDGSGGDSEEDEDDEINPWEVPDEPKDKLMWAMTFPIDVSLYCTIPQCGVEEKKDKYLVSFFMSLVWIAIFAYLMVWWITIIGATLNLDSTVMGLTIIAAGTSIPDALSSVAVAREGYGDMAVSSSIGSNVFDILVGLPVPWMIKTGVISIGKQVEIKSDYLLAQTLTLIMMVGLLVGSIMFTGWKLGKRLGFIMFLLYVVFLVISLYMEFGKPDWLSSKKLAW